MNWRVACVAIITGTSLMAACQPEAQTDGSSVPAGAASVQPEPVDGTPSGLPRVEVAPPPRRVYEYSEFRGRVIEVGRDSITVQGFGIRLNGKAAQEVDRNGWRKGIYTWKSGPNGEPFLIWSGPLGPRHDIKGEVRPGTYCGPGGGGLDIPAVAMVRTRESVTITHPDGKVSVLRREDEPPRTFGLHWSYTVGGFPDTVVYPLATHRPADLRPGDEVFLHFWPYNLVHLIQIERRPGGKIPPTVCVLREGRSIDKELPPYHEMMQAYQDWEEKGTPIPWKFLSRDERAERIAPPPREVFPRIPPVKD